MMLPHKAYHGGIARPDWTQGAHRSEQVLWLDKNENIDPAYNQIVTQWLRDLTPQAMNGYPDGSILYHKLAKQLDIAANNLIFAAGSDGVIRLAYEAFLQPGDKVLYPTPTFAMYAVYAQMVGAQPLTADYQRAVHDAPWLEMNRFIELILTERPKLVCLPCPDSPTGAVVSQTVLRDIIHAAKKVNAVVLIDEAYYPFYDRTVLPWIREEENLLVTRTFSKAWGLAGIRLGYGAGHPDLIAAMHKLRPMYEAGNLTMTLALYALDHATEMQASVQRLQAGKYYFMDALKKRGFDVLENVHGNFLHVAFGQHAEAVHRALAQRVLYRKDFGHPCLAGYSRFSATTVELFTPVVEWIAAAMNASTAKTSVSR